MAGRKTKYTPGTVKAITDAISVGLGIGDACRLADVSYQTYERWSKQHVEFVDACEKAEATLKARKLARIEKAGREGTWQADAWVLERKHPEEFGQRFTIKVTAEQAMVLKRFGKTASQAFEELIQTLSKVENE